MEPKFGLAVTGLVKIEELLKNSGVEPGDAIVLTKPVGTGVIFNGVKSGRLPYRDAENILPQVAKLNGGALPVLRKHGVKALTDVTGFGIGGHLYEMAEESGISLRIKLQNLPTYPYARELYRRGETTGSNRFNREYVGSNFVAEASLTREDEGIIFDPQTSGGLLASVPSENAEEAVRELRESGYPGSAVIGVAVESQARTVVIE
jgi:selenide,water dikinase